jgi:hypothetical protein
LGDVDLATVGKKLADVGSAPGEDWFLYLLRREEIIVISESGTIVRRMPFKKPNPELFATRIDVSGGLADVELVKDQGMGKPVKIQLFVLNASTGDRLAFYEPGPELGNNLLCFSQSAGFVFFTVRDGKTSCDCGHALNVAVRVARPEQHPA